MLNLFLAVLLGNFDNARLYMEKKKLFSAFEKYSNQNLPLDQSLKLVLGKIADQVMSFAHMENPHKTNYLNRRVKTISSIASKLQMEDTLLIDQKKKGLLRQSTLLKHSLLKLDDSNLFCITIASRGRNVKNSFFSSQQPQARKSKIDGLCSSKEINTVQEEKKVELNIFKSNN